MNGKRLYRVKEGKILAGVFTGLGKYFDIDPTLIRIIYVLIALFTTGVPCTILYIVMALIVPEEPEQNNYNNFEGK